MSYKCKLLSMFYKLSLYVSLLICFDMKLTISAVDFKAVRCAPCLSYKFRTQVYMSQFYLFLALTDAKDKVINITVGHY